MGEGAAMDGVCVFADRLRMLRLCKRPWLQLLVVWMCPHEASRVANIDRISSHDQGNRHWGRKTCLWKADSIEIGGRMGGRFSAWVSECEWMGGWISGWMDGWVSGVVGG